MFEESDMYDMSQEVKRCGNKIQDTFGITPNEFQAARKIGKKKKLGDILAWIEEHRQKAPRESAPVLPNVTPVARTSPYPGVAFTPGIVLVPVPIERLNEVFAALAR